MCASTWQHEVLNQTQPVWAKNAQVNSICFLEPFPVLATCNLEGMIAIWRMGPAPDSRRDYDEPEEHDDATAATETTTDGES